MFPSLKWNPSLEENILDGDRCSHKTSFKELLESPSQREVGDLPGLLRVFSHVVSCESVVQAKLCASND